METVPAPFAFAELTPIDPPPPVRRAPAVAEPAEPEIDVDALRAAAWEEGHAAGRAAAAEELAPAVAALHAAAVGVDAARDAAAAEAERAAVDLALRIAEQIVRASIDAAPERVLDTVTGALRRLMDRERVIVLVHPDDLELVRDRTPEVIAPLGGIEHCEVQADRRVARGGAIIRTIDGEVDATLPTKLERMRELIAEELRG